MILNMGIHLLNDIFIKFTIQVQKCAFNGKSVVLQIVYIVCIYLDDWSISWAHLKLVCLTPFVR